MLSLAILWAVQGASGSFAVAGLSTGAFATAEAFLAPQVARLVDNHGQRLVIAVQLPIFTLASISFIVATSLHARPWVWLVTSAIAGVACPQIGSLAAARWRHLTAGSSQMPTALSLEAAVNESGFMIGPVLVTALSASVHPSVGLVVATSLVLVFTMALIRRRDSEPSRQARGPGLVLDARLLTRTFAPFPVLHLLLGIYFGGVTICLTAAAQALGAGEFAGLMAAGGGALSLLTGLIYGSAAHRVRAGTVMIVGSVVLTASCFALSQSSGLAPLVLFSVVAGGCIAPIIVPAAVRLQEAIPAPVYVQAITWTGSASALGIAVASPMVGRLIDQSSPQTGYLALSMALVLETLAALAVRATTRSGRR